MMYKILAWVSVVFLFYNFSLFPLHRLLKNAKFARKFLLYSSKIHRFTGFTLIITGISHGYLALGTIKFHTGFVLWLGIVLLFSYYLLRKFLRRRWLIFHRYTDFAVIVMFFIHFFIPWLF